MTAASPWTAPPVKFGSSYSAVAMALHWIIAAFIAVQLGLGWYMNEVLPDHSLVQDQVTAIHISVGLTLLLLVVVRIVWRLLNPPPRLPAGLAPWERLLSRTVHGLFYVLMLVIPLTGWALVSAGKEPISFWGIAWPKIPGLANLARPQHHLLKHTHVFILIWVFVANWALHVAGALKHQFDGKPVLWRMVPFLKPKP